MTLYTRSLKALTLLVWLAAMLLGASSQATAQTIVDHCGQTLKQPGTYILASDLDCSGTHLQHGSPRNAPESGDYLADCPQ